MSWLVQPRLVNGPYDDPGIFLDFRFGRRAFLFDLGDVTPLSGRELLRVSHAFVSHTHMDHMAGCDRLLRVSLHRSAPLTLVGPPAFLDQIQHRVRSYTWNLLGDDSPDFELCVMEFDGAVLTRAASFRAREAFRRRDKDPPHLPPGVVLAEENLTVEAVALNHGIPSLAFALRQDQRVNVRRGALEELRLPVGPWLNGAKEAARRGAPDDLVIAIPGRGRIPLGEFKDRLFRIGPGQVVAYVTDAAPDADNRSKILALAKDADQLFIEAVFLDRDRELAAASLHLTAWEAGTIAREAGAKHLIPFHHSARYLSDPDALPREALTAFRGGLAPPADRSGVC